MGQIQEVDGHLEQVIYGRLCKSPPIPKNREALHGYGNPKGKFVRAADIAPEFMLRIDKDRNKWTEKQLAYIERELSKIYFSGEFQYIKGQLTWIPPWLYLLMNWWPVSVKTHDGKIEYRDEQRRKFCFLWDVYKHPFDLGVVDMKKRRTFGSTMAQMLCYWHATLPGVTNQTIGQTSYTKEMAQKNFANLLVPSLRKIPMWFQATNTVTKEGVFFNTKLGDIKYGIENTTKESSIIFAPPSPKLFDSTELMFAFVDETGKWPDVNINDAWGTLQECLRLGIIQKVGWAYMPTTVDDKENGGEGFAELWDNAAEKTRGANRSTANGLVQYFSPAEHGLQGFIGSYGEDVTHTPDDEQWAYMSMVQSAMGIPVELQIREGSIQFLEREFKHLEDNGNERGFMKMKRKYPRDPADVFISSSDKCPFNVNILSSLLPIISQQEFKNQYIARGYLAWKDPVARTEVEWVTDEKGIIQATWFPSNLNNVIKRPDGIYPGNENTGCFGLDPYNKSKVLHEGKASNASLHGKLYFNHSYEVQHRQTPKPDYHPTYSYFLRYNDRKFIDEDIYEMYIMIMHYFGMPMAIEAQYSRGFETYATHRGYSNFLLRKPEIDGNQWPTEAESEYVGIPMTDQYALQGVTYHDMFLRGRGAHLGEFTYDLVQTPLRFPFQETAEDHLKFNMKNRKPHDDSMSCLIVSIAEAGICNFGAPPDSSFSGNIELPSGLFW
jgi:hypothetical protein